MHISYPAPPANTSVVYVNYGCGYLDNGNPAWGGPVDLSLTLPPACVSRSPDLWLFARAIGSGGGDVEKGFALAEAVPFASGGTTVSLGAWAAPRQTTVVATFHNVPAGATLLGFESQVAAHGLGFSALTGENARPEGADAVLHSHVPTGFGTAFLDQADIYFRESRSTIKWFDGTFNTAPTIDATAALPGVSGAALVPMPFG